MIGILFLEGTPVRRSGGCGLLLTRKKTPKSRALAINIERNRKKSGNHCMCHPGHARLTRRFFPIWGCPRVLFVSQCCIPTISSRKGKRIFLWVFFPATEGVGKLCALSQRRRADGRANARKLLSYSQKKKRVLGHPPSNPSLFAISILTPSVPPAPSVKI